MAKRNAKPFKWGTSFRNKKLYVFDNKSVIVASGWPEIRAWRKTASTNWRPIRLDFRLDIVLMTTCGKKSLFPISRHNIVSPDIREMEVNEEIKSIEEGKQDRMIESGGKLHDRMKGLFAEKYMFEAYRKWKSLIPADIASVVKEFPDRQWHLLAMLARCKNSVDLVRSNPALAYCLASNWAFHKPAVSRPMRAIRSLVKKKQKDILLWLGFPGTESAVKIFKKVKPEIISMILFYYFRSAMKNKKALKMLAHFKTLNQAIINVLGNRSIRSLFSGKALHEIAGLNDELFYTNYYAKLRDIAEMAKMTGYHKIKHYSSIEKIDKIHDSLVSKLYADPSTAEDYRFKLKVKYGFDFPEPPLSGNSNIVPVTDAKMLFNEGMDQHNCIYSYMEKIYSGNYYIYKVLEPERASLSVVKNGNLWEIGEIKGNCNAPVKQETLGIAEDWLKTANNQERFAVSL